MAIIHVADLHKTFQVKRKEAGLAGSLRAFWRPAYSQVDAVKGVTFEVEEGETLAFIGPNGAGKSTTIKMLTGILHPTSGEAQVLGLVPWRQRQRLAYQIGSVFGQKSQLWYHLPPVDTFNLLAKIYELEPQAYRRRQGELVEAFEIQGLLQTPVRKMSLGERMRCEIAASLLHRPKVLFLDEPTIGLDVIAKQKIRDLIRLANREDRTTVFLTSHDAGDIEQLCRRVVIVNHGTIIYDDSVNRLKREHLRTRVISLKLAEPWAGFEMTGVRVLKAKEYGVKLEIDIAVAEVQAAVAGLLARYSVADMTIEDPPMEAIISSVFAAARPGAAAPSAGSALTAAAGSAVAGGGE
ncbi:MAG: ABC transporter ATP-binding protein [Symbiobacteriia bacterium]